MTTRPTLSPLLRVSRTLAMGLLATLGLHGQGSLTPPPGAPSPTMKTLDQIEARIIVNTANTPGDSTNSFIITAPGSYYLTGNLTGASGKNGISIVANNVTLDLNGFALIGGGGATRGVNTTIPVTNFCIRNGSVSGWSGGGVRADFAVTLAEKLLLADNVGATGLTVGNGSMVKDCVASGNATGFFCPDRTQISHCISTVNTGAGFDGTGYINLLDCTSSRNGGNGIVTQGGCSLLRCSATRNLPSGSGIVVGDNCTLSNCTAANNGMSGISAGAGCGVTDCAAGNNLGPGISVGDGSTVRNCTARANGAAGIGATSSCQVSENTCAANASGIAVTAPGGSGGQGNRIDGNSCSRNQIGFSIFGLNNFIVRNHASGSTSTNFSISAPLLNHLGPIESSGSTVTSTSPWTNFSY